MYKHEGSHGYLLETIRTVRCSHLLGAKMNIRTGISLTVVFVCISAASCGRRSDTAKEAERTRVDAPRSERSANIQSYAQVVDRVSGSVLTIRSSRRVRQPRQFPFLNDPMFEEFFGRRFRGAPQGQEQLQQGLGSGVIVRDDGHCVTNHHVIDGAEDIRVEFADGTSYRAKLVGSLKERRTAATSASSAASSAPAARPPRPFTTPTPGALRRP